MRISFSVALGCTSMQTLSGATEGKDIQRMQESREFESSVSSAATLKDSMI